MIVRVVFLHFVHSVVRVHFFPLCFIIGDREFLTGGPTALRHTRCLLGIRMFLVLFLLFYLLWRDKSGAKYFFTSIIKCYICVVTLILYV